MTLQPFFAASTPLSPGTTLLEASAGTGKTYTLTAIFLRLIVSEKLLVSEILVSTFTDPATRELKDRIRTRLIAAHQAFSENKATDEVTEALLSRHAAELPCATRRLSDAIRDLDQAQISTIHGFCQRTLREFALESGQPFSAELRPDLTPQLHTVVGDFLRQTLHTANPTAALLLGPPEFEELLDLLSLTLNKPAMVLQVPPGTPQLPEALHQLSDAQSQLRSLWQREGATITRLLTENGDWTRKNGAASPEKIAPLLADLGEWLCADSPDAECLAFQNTGGLEAIANLQQSQLNKVANKKKTAPQHPFFETVETFVLCANQLSHAFHLTFLQVAPETFRTLKQQQNLLGFNDLLDELRNALLREGGMALRQNLRKRFRAALLDEFQDTDPVQDEIFSTLFPSQQETGAPPRWLFLIGDPKQAIYSFRGADIHTYLAARNRAHHHYSLGTNYRSEARLVHAVNHLFERHDRPFVLDSIPFAPVAPTAIPPLLSAAGQPLPAFNLWVRTDEKPLKAAESAAQLVESVATAIAQLLNSGATIAGKPLLPSQIAVLISVNRQGPLVQDALRKVGVPSVLFSDESVFATPDADNLLVLLRAIATPNRAQGIRRALATPLLGWTAEAILTLQDDPATWEKLSNEFRHLREIWATRGFVLLFSTLLQQWDIRNRLLQRPDGERCLTNILHLGELLAEAAQTHTTLSGPLLRWLELQLTRQPQQDATAASKMRLESDAQAVQILTQHKSKGLEWEVVFCPFTWQGGSTRKYAKSQPVVPETTADGKTRHRLYIAALGKTKAAKEYRKGSLQPHIDREAAAEQTRLLYVAATRAKRLCCLAWGNIKDAATSGPGWVFHGNSISSTQWEDIKHELKARQAPDPLASTLREITETSDQNLALTHWPEPDALPWNAPAVSVTQLTPKILSHPIPQVWGISSFTSLTANTEHSNHDTDAHVHSPPAPPAPEDVSIHAFPSGAAAGTCLHAIFEYADFNDPASIDAETQRQLLIANFATHKAAPSLAEAVKAVLAAPLNFGFSLRDTEATRRKVEVEFDLPMARLNSKQLQNALSACGMQVPPFGDREGLLTGVIDLVCEHQGRFYLIDWKSNRLGQSAEDYTPERMEEAMQQNHYLLQLHLYTLALHRHLTTRLPDYSYETHFGGAVYIFARGIDPARPNHGLYEYRPEWKTVQALDSLFQHTPNAR